MKVMFDLDGVVAEFVGPFHAWALANVDRTLPYPSLAQWDFFAEWEWSRGQVAEALDGFSADGGWRSLPADQEMVSAVSEVMGFADVEFVTSRPGAAFDDSVAWLAEVFDGAEFGFRLEPSPKRCGAEFDVAFDDSDANVRSLAASGCGLSRLVVRPWNEMCLLPRVRPVVDDVVSVVESARRVRCAA